MIVYSENIKNITPEMLEGFFVGWNKYPDKNKHLEILKNSDFVVIAMDDNKIIGFINAISDKVLSAYIPLLEVLPEYQGRGIGTELVKRMKILLKDFYMVDVVCDAELQKFYERQGFKKLNSMIIRNYENQEGSQNK